MAIKIAEGYVDVKAVVDDPSFRRSAQQAGRRAGDHFATAFGIGSSRRWRRMKGLFLEPVNLISSALSSMRGPSLRAGILSAILGLIPSAGKAATALSASLIPALISLGSVVGVVRLMLGDLSKDIKGQTLKALNSMASSIRDLAREAAKPGLNKLMEGVVKNGPMFEKYIQRIAQAVGDALGEVGDLLGNQGFVNKLNSLLEQTAESTGIWTKSLDDLVEMVVTLGDAASPIFREIAEWVNRVTDRWRDWLNLKYETGELQEMLQGAWEELQRWARILGNVIGGLFNIFAAGVGPSSQFAENLERMTASFKEWTEQSENIEKIRAFFQFMVDHVDDFLRIAASALVIAGALKGVAAAFEVIDFARTIAMLGPVGVAFAVVGVAVAGLAATLMFAYNSSELFRAKVDELWHKIQDDLLPILQEWWTWIREELGPALEEFANGVMQTVITAFDMLIQKYRENEKGIKTMRQLFVDLLPVIGFFASMAVVAIAGFVGSMMVAVGWAGRLYNAIVNVPTKWMTKYSWLPGAAMRLVASLTSKIRNIPRTWRTVFRFLPGAAVRVISNIANWINRIPRSVRTVFTVVRNIITNPLGGLFGGRTGGLIGGRGMASGGLSGAGSTVLVGEDGPELVRLPFGSKVTPHGQSRAQMAKAGSGAPVVLEIRSGGARLDDLLVHILQKAIRERAGGRPNSVQVVLGRA